MRKPKEIKIHYHYVGDDSPEEKAEAEQRLDEIFDDIFKSIILKKAKEKEASQSKK